jgi:hypothetical protein
MNDDVTVKFLGPTDISGVNFDKLYYLGAEGVSLYASDAEKPPIGHKLNKPA